MEEDQTHGICLYVGNYEGVGSAERRIARKHPSLLVRPQRVDVSAGLKNAVLHGCCDPVGTTVWPCHRTTSHLITHFLLANNMLQNYNEWIVNICRTESFHQAQNFKATQCIKRNNMVNFVNKMRNAFFIQFSYASTESDTSTTFDCHRVYWLRTQTLEPNHWTHFILFTEFGCWLIFFENYKLCSDRAIRPSLIVDIIRMVSFFKTLVI